MTAVMLICAITCACLVLQFIHWPALYSDTFPVASWRHWWRSSCGEMGWPAMLDRLPVWQTLLCPPLLILSCVQKKPIMGLLVVAAALMPFLLLKQSLWARRRSIQKQVDGLLTRLAYSLATVPNLTDALRSVASELPQPMKSEIEKVLMQVRLGRDVCDALKFIGDKLRIPGFSTAVLTVAIGRRTGGNLSLILKQTAGTLREIERLEGVVRVSTAEGRGQAVVMGLVPPALVLMLQFINPQWLAPMWSDPIGWCILGGVCILEAGAMALVRKITAVNI